MEMNFLIPSKIIDNSSFTKFSNNWSPIQAYYSVFLGLRAFYLASGYNLKNSHEATLTFTSFYAKKSVFPFPWCCFCDGEKELGNLNFVNFKKKTLHHDIKILTTLHKNYFEDVYAKFLRTTREKEYEKKKKDYRKQENIKRIIKKNGFIVDIQVPSTTFLDCLYRLRKRSYYDNVDGFLVSNAVMEDTVEFYESLKIILETTLFMIESVIRECIGVERFGEMIREFTEEVFKEKKDEIGIFRRKVIFLGQRNLNMIGTEKI
jgi:hypothetical protein